MSGTPHPAASARRAALGLAAAVLAALLLALGPSALAGVDLAKPPLLDQTGVAGERHAREAYAKLPLGFVPNAGQTDPRVRFSAQADGASFYFTQKEAVFALMKGQKGVALRLAFLGANPAPSIEGLQRGPGRVNYLLGNDPAEWHTNLAAYEQVVYRDLWPGVDLVFRGERGRLKYEFRVAPGASVRDIRLAYRGQNRLALARAGDLRLDTALGVLRDSRPASYQTIAGKRVPVASRYVLDGGGRRYGFELGAYDRGRPLVIDPGLAYSTFLGGSGADAGRGIAVDGTGSAYVTGSTGSTAFPTTVGALDMTYNGNTDAFVTKLNPAGSTLVYSTYLGGSDLDFGTSIAVDGAGSAHAAGFTVSSDFPTTVGAFDTIRNGTDAYVSKLNATGSGLVYSTFLGGSGDEGAQGIAVDGTGSAYVTGSTANAANFPTTVGAFDTTFNGSQDAFVTKLNAVGSSLVYSTFLGGNVNEVGFGIVTDSAGSASVTGVSSSANFPTTAGAFDTTNNGGQDAFITKLNAIGSALVYSTYLGGSSQDRGLGIAVDVAGNAYVAGFAQAADFPTTLGAFDTTFTGSQMAFVAKLNAAGSALVYSTFLGGGGDQAAGIALDVGGSAYVTGFTLSSGFPTTAGAFDTTPNGGQDAFVSKLNAGGSALLYSTYLGGTSSDEGLGIAVDAAGSAYVTGLTGSANFPTTPGTFDTTPNGQDDAFVTKLDAIGAPAVLTLSPPAATNPTGMSHTVTATVTDAAGQPVPNVVVRFTVSGAHNLTGSCTTGQDGQCGFSYTGAVAGMDTITAYADSNSNAIQDPGEPTGGPVTKTWVPAPSPCPPGDDDRDDDGLDDDLENLFGALLGDRDSDDDGVADGNEDSDDDGEDDEDEDDDSDPCPDDSDGDGEDDEDEDDEDDD